MSYMVIFRTPEGKPGYQQAGGVPEAVETVERLRNQDGVENVRIFRMEEVAFEYKVHYTVEIKDGPPSAPAEVGAAPAGETPAAAAPSEPAPSEPAPSAAEPEPRADALSWDDDLDQDDSVGGAPFDQMKAIDPNGVPRWGDEGADRGRGDDAGGDLSDAAARRGLFGR